MTSEEKITLESSEFANQGQRLTSPRSIEACRLIGVAPMELYPLTFDEYVLQHYEIRNLQKNLQEERYRHFDKIRTDNIALAKQKRSELVEQEKNNKSKSHISNKSTGNNASAVREEKEKLEKMKKRQNNTLKIMIDYEFAMEERRKKNEDTWSINERNRREKGKRWK